MGFALLEGPGLQLQLPEADRRRLACFFGHSEKGEPAAVSAQLQTQEPADVVVPKPEPGSPTSASPAAAGHVQLAAVAVDLGTLVVPAVDPTVPTHKESTPFICCTCGQETTESVTCARHNKGSEVRRCKKCHAAKSAIQRLARAHDGLVQDFSKIDDKTAVKNFFKEHGHLRGKDLVVRLEETVQTWTTETTKNSFSGSGEYVDEHELWQRYKDKPDAQEQFENIKKNAKQIFDRVRGVTLYEDMHFKSSHEDIVEKGKKRQRKICAQQEMAEQPEGDEEEANDIKKPLFPRSKKAKGDDKQQPKLKKGDRSKINKRMEGIASQRMQCLDLLSRVDKFADMVPTYVCDCAKDCINEALAAQEEVDKILHDGHGSANDVLEQADKIFNNISSATTRLKVQVEQAVSFKSS